MSLPTFAYEGVGYRGLRLDGNEELERKYLDHKNEFIVGNLMTFPAFMSISTDDSVADHFGDYVFFVFVKVRGARIAQLSQVPKEAEVLVPPPSVFRIKAVAKFGGRLTVTLEQVDSPLTYVSQTASESVLDFVASDGLPSVFFPVQDECIKISEAVAIQLPSSVASLSHETPSVLNIMKWFQCQCCNCCASDYNPCTADFEPPHGEGTNELAWFTEPFCAFFGMRIPFRCCYGRWQDVHDRRRELCGMDKENIACCICCCGPCLFPFWVCSILYFVSLSLATLPWLLCYFLAGCIRECEKPCCGRPSTLFKLFYYPPQFLALSIRWLWRLCGSRTCFGLFRSPCGPDCKVHHDAICIVCGKRHKGVKFEDENHQCQDGRRGSFAWNFEEDDPICQ